MIILVYELIFQISIYFRIKFAVSIMRPSPFAGKFKRPTIKANHKENQDNQYQQKDDNHINEGASKSNQPKFSLNKKKEAKQIYEAIRQKEPEANDDDTHQTKNSLNLRPNLKLKAGKKIKLGPQTPSMHEKKIEEDQFNQEHQEKEHSSFAAKLAPFPKTNLGNRDRSREKPRQQIIIGEQNNANVEDSMEGSISQQSGSFSIAPKFRLKSRGKNNANEQQPIIQQNYEQQDRGNTYSNFANHPIETRQINLEPSIHAVSQARIQKQTLRTNQLRKMLNLEIDLFEQTLQIPCVTPYEIYISKIKSGTWKNSCDQSFDEKSVSSCQTLPLEFDDFVNQCPQDYHTDVLNIFDSSYKTDEEEALDKFISKISPVVQELIKPSNSIVMPPIFLLALKPEFKKLVNCPFPVFIYESSFYKIGIIVIGQKLYISQDTLTSVISIGNNLVGGTKDGNLVLWTGKNNKNSRLHHKIFDIIQSTNFELPQYETHEIDKFSVYRNDMPIIKFLDENSVNNDEFLSLDESGKINKWKIQNQLGVRNQLKPLQSFQLSNLLRRQSLIAYNIKKRNQIYFISTSAGIIVWNGSQIQQKLLIQSSEIILDFSLPHRSNLVYTISSDNFIRIYDQSFQNTLLKMEISAQNGLSQEMLGENLLIIPELEYQNKKLSLTGHIYLNSAHQQILHFKVLQNNSEPEQLTKYGNRGSGKSDRNIIFQGINVLEGGTFQQVTLWRDLKCTSEVRRMDCDLTPNVSNVKHVLEENRKVFALLETQAAYRG